MNPFKKMAKCIDAANRSLGRAAVAAAQDLKFERSDFRSLRRHLGEMSSLYRRGLVLKAHEIHMRFSVAGIKRRKKASAARLVQLRAAGRKGGASRSERKVASSGQNLQRARAAKLRQCASRRHSVDSAQGYLLREDQKHHQGRK